ncbi:MAG: DUF2065 domain-containing protein [Pseudomonadota bacterium]
MKDFLTALALLLVIEGAAYALFPAAIQRLMAQALAQPAHVLRGIGIAATLGGLVFLWVVRGLA